MDPALQRAAMKRVNAVVAERARTDGSAVVFVCECGRCGGQLVQSTLATYDRIRAGDAYLLLPEHRDDLRPSSGHAV